MLDHNNRKFALWQILINSGKFWNCNLIHQRLGTRDIKRAFCPFNQKATKLPSESIQLFRTSSRFWRFMNDPSWSCKFPYVFCTLHKRERVRMERQKWRKGNYLGAVWNFPRQLFEAESERIHTHLEVGQTRRACHANRFVLSRNARFARGSRTWERDREREGGNLTAWVPSDAGLHQTGITHIRLG